MMVVSSGIVTVGSQIAGMSAGVKKKGNRWCVIHTTTGAVLKRKGHRVCFDTQRKAAKEALKTQCRVKGGSACRRV